MKKEEWFYSEKVKDHFFNPRNIIKTDEEEAAFKADGMGIVGSPACGDVMKIWIKVKDDKITECKWKTFGCASAIASTSILSEMVKGKTLDEALKITPNDIVKEMKGLPARKIHCSVLGDRALREAIYDYFRKTNQESRITVKKTRVIDTLNKITEADIEEAVLHGARTFEEVQQQTKVCVGCTGCKPQVEKIIQDYVDKYYMDE